MENEHITRPVSYEDAEEYVLKADREKEGAPVFLLGYMPDEHYISLIKAGEELTKQEESTKGSVKFVEAMTFQNKSLELGLKGWKNFNRHDGTEIPFKRATHSVNGVSFSGASLESISEIRRKNRQELTEAILAINGLGEVEKKESKPSSG